MGDSGSAVKYVNLNVFSRSHRDELFKLDFFSKHFDLLPPILDKLSTRQEGRIAYRSFIRDFDGPYNEEEPCLITQIRGGNDYILSSRRFSHPQFYCSDRDYLSACKEICDSQEFAPYGFFANTHDSANRQPFLPPGMVLEVAHRVFYSYRDSKSKTSPLVIDFNENSFLVPCYLFDIEKYVGGGLDACLDNYGVTIKSLIRLAPRIRDVPQPSGSQPMWESNIVVCSPYLFPQSISG